MAPRNFGTGAPQCTRCGKSVYAAEQVIGPMSKPYHKPCLACTVCNKRLDSTLLAEHEGEAYCKNCHKAHLGQGKGGFGLAVPLRPEKPASLKYQSTGASTSSTGSAGRSAVQAPRAVAAAGADEDDALAQYMSGINIAPRKDNPAPAMRSEAPSSQRGEWEMHTVTRPRTNLSRPTTVAQSIDDLVASGYEVPVPHARAGGSGTNGAAASKAEIGNAIYGTTGSTSTIYRDAGDDNTPGQAMAPTLETSGRSASPSRTSSRDTDFQQSFASNTPTSSSASAAGPQTPPPLASRETIGAVRFGEEMDKGSLPPAVRKDPIALAREREKGLLSSSGSGMVKTYSPRTTPISSRSPPKASTARGEDAENASPYRHGVQGSSEVDHYRYTPNSALSKMGLGSTVHAAAVGTPLCARCERPVYFAEQKQAASRKWHRACLRCDGCSTTLESGKLEEGPLSATYQYPTNVWCRPCYAKRFGPKGIGVAGMSLPEMSR